MPTWAWIVAAVGGFSIAGLGIWIDRRQIRTRVLACGGKNIRILGPFLSWGYEARMDHRRYDVQYTDAKGLTRELTVFVAFGYLKIDGSDSF